MERSALGVALCAIVIGSSCPPGVHAEDRSGWPPAAPLRPSEGGARSPDLLTLQALQANPITAPYPISVSWQKGRIILSGRVGTGQVHDAAVRTVIALGYPIRDDLVIDTAEAHRVALEQTLAQPGSWGNTAGSSPYFVYPEPLFGRVDDPFFGMEPPLVSFPPWATARPRETAALPAQAQPAARPGGRPQGGPVKGQIELTVDAAGQVFLRGLVASEADKKVIEDEARNTPGVTRVYSELKVAAARSNTPPPPPRPYQPDRPEAQPAAPPARPRVEPQRPAPAPAEQPAPRPANETAIARDAQKLTRRVADALGRSPALSGLPIAVTSRSDVVTLAGKVPSAYEAMLAYRAVEQTPGVRDIVDQLQFPVPDENHPNPLRQKARPDDLEPYLTSQIRRHLGDMAHVERVRSRGDLLEIRGTIAAEEDQERVRAVLRSMPLLREFRLDAAFQTAR
ncbi:MAG: BON domain-containing protein [Isosphaeraceae bacterium]